MKLLDTTFLIDVLRGDPATRDILNTEEPLFTTQINMFEVVRGLFAKKYSHNKARETLVAFDSIHVLPLDEQGILNSAEIYASLIKKGMEVPDADCLIAGIAQAHKVCNVVTRNVKHFKRIKGFKIQTY